MLTLDLIRIRYKGDEIIPRYIDPDDERLQAVAAELVNIYQEHQGSTRESLQETLDDFLGQGKRRRYLPRAIKVIG